MCRVRKRSRGSGSQEKKSEKYWRADASAAIQEERVLAWQAVNKLIDQKRDRT